MIRFTSLPIRIQLISLAILLTLPALGIIVYSGMVERREDYRKAAVESQKLADNLAATQENFTQAAMELGSLIADLPDVRNRNVMRSQSVITNIQKKNPQYQNILITDASGNVWASAISPQERQSVADRLYFRKVKATLRFSSGEFVFSKISSKPTIAVAFPLVEKNEFQGAVVLSFNLDVLRSILERSQLPDGNYILVDHRGIIVSRGTNSGRNVGEPIQPADLKKMVDGPDRDTYEFIRNDGDRRITTYRKLRIPGETQTFMYVRAGMSFKDAVARANTQLVRNILLLLPFVITAFCLAVFIGSRSIVNRIARLQNAALCLADGQLDVRVEHLVSGGELGNLGHTFDTMASKLQAMIAELQYTQLALHEKAVMLEDEIAERQMTQESLTENQLQLEELNRTLEKRIDVAVTELRKKDQSLIQQSRLAAMGEMINNIAHQWRQPLNLIALIIQGLPQTGELSQAQLDKETERIMDILMHMSQTVDDFRNFFREDKEKTSFSAYNAIEKAVGLTLSSLQSRNIEIAVHGDREVSVFGYENEYAQVLLNLIINARDVLIERKIAQPYIRLFVDHAEKHSLVTISDNGGGISEAILPQVFDPYFTTKEKNQGTGIGLYMSKMIIEQNMGGNLTVSNTDIGAQFRIEV